MAAAAAAAAAAVEATRGWEGGCGRGRKGGRPDGSSVGTDDAPPPGRVTRVLLRPPAGVAPVLSFRERREGRSVSHESWDAALQPRHPITAPAVGSDGGGTSCGALAACFAFAAPVADGGFGAGAVLGAACCLRGGS